MNKRLEEAFQSTLERIPTDEWKTHTELQISLATLSVLNERGLVRKHVGTKPGNKYTTFWVYWKRIPKEETQ